MKTLLTASALALATLATGCATSVNTVTRAQPQANTNIVEDKRVLTDLSLGRNVAIVSVNEAKASGNLLQIQVTLRNKSSSAQAFDYKFDWIDSSGMELSSPTGGWKQIQLEGKEERSISAIALKPTAVDFRLKLREKQ
jgi:uncharacterized protein YcfL